jgi:glycosyltransferase involved in cell wall biosynthesis
MKDKKRILIIIPAFNEAESVAGVIDDIRAELPVADIVVVNDGSGDETARVAEEAGVTVLSHPYNMGIGATMQTGFKYAVRKGYDVAVQVDADGQHPADQLEKVVGPVLRDEADMVVGSRFLSGSGDGDARYRPSVARGAGIAFFSKVVSRIIREKVTDTTSGFRASGRECIDFFSRRYPDDYPEVEALVLLHKRDFSIMEVPVRMRERAGGRTSITPLRSVYYMVKVLLAIFVDLLKKTDR